MANSFPYFFGKFRDDSILNLVNNTQIAVV